ncbi:tape measure protein [Pseudomonas tussilaginis]|uniref:tape measure protein n=1 Tax=Pseudomonas putida TaxID=303 RepID=UPI0023644ECA|nr:tape measure protein [Pseudomonas putida]MDD1979009.1 tape measure protein [Pseudomonas putida]
MATGQTLRSLIVSVSAETGAYQREMARASRMGSNYLRTIGDGNRQAAAGWRSQQAAIEAQNSALQSLAAGAGEYVRAMAGALAVGSVITMADGWNQVNARLKLASASQADFIDNQQAIFDLSQRTGTAFSANANLFSRSAASMREFGYNSADAVQMTEVLATGLRLSGAGAEETASVITQMAQALGQGVLRGEEFNAVNESGDRIIRALAAGMGVQRKALKSMADDGKLTIDKVVPALISQLGVLRDEYKQLPGSVSAGFTALHDSMQAWVGGMDGATGTTQALSSALMFAADNLDLLAAAAAATGIAYVTKHSLAAANALREQFVASRAAASAEVGRTAAQIDAAAASLRIAQADAIAAQRRVAFATTTVEATAASRALTAAKLAEIEATNALSRAQTANAAAASLGARAGAGLLSLLGGPIGLAALVAGTAASFLLFSSNAEAANVAASDLKRPVSELRKEWEELGNAQRRPILAKLLEEQEAAKAKAAEIVREMQAVAQGPTGDYTGSKRFEANQYQRASAAGNFRRSIAGGIDVDQATQNLTQSIRPNEEVRSTLQALAAQYQENIGKVSVLGDQINTLNGVMAGAKAAAEGVSQGLNSIQPPSQAVISAWEKRIETLGEQAAKLKDSSELGEINRQAERDNLAQTAEGKALLARAQAAAQAKDAGEKAKKAQEDAAAKAKQQAAAAARQAKQLEDSYSRTLRTLREQADVHGSKTELAKIEFEVSKGTLSQLDQAKKTELERAAIAVDNLNTQKAYKDLLEQVKRGEDGLLVTTRQRYAELAQLNKQGGLSADQYRDGADRISKASVGKAPKFDGLDASIGGPGGELIKVAQADKELAKWHDKELKRQEELHNAKLISEQQYLDRVAEINLQNHDRLGSIQDAYKSASLAVFADLTGNAADMMKQMAGEGSAAYKALFLASKAAAIAQTIVSTEVAAAKALELGPIMGIGAASLIRGLGYASVGMIGATTIMGMAHDGIDNIPKEGTWLLQKGERVVDGRTNSDLKRFLSQSPAQGGAAATSQAPQIHIHINSDGSGGEVVATDGYAAMGQALLATVREEMPKVARGVIIKEKGQNGLLDPSNRRNG